MTYPLARLRAETAAAHGVTVDLLETVYEDLRRLARSFLSRRGPGHTLQPTALVHEAWIKLERRDRDAWSSRTHFIAASAATMRHVLVNHSRRREALKRGGGFAERVELDDAVSLYEGRCIDLLMVDEALNRLASVAPRQARTVELRFFGGLSIEEAAETLGLSKRTVERDWRTARAWLRTEMDADTSGG